MKSILGFLLIGFVTINAHSQDRECKAFINNFFDKSAKLVYRDRVGEHVIENMKEALNQDTLYALGARFNQADDRLLLTQQERNYIQHELKLLAQLTWTDELFENGKALTKAVIDSIYNDRTRGWSYFKKHYGSRLYNFSKPIFLRTHSLCVFYSGYSCGPRCGEGQLMLFRKKNGTWEHWMDLYRWVS